MRLDEAIAAECLDLTGNLLDDRRIVSARNRLLDEFAELDANELGVFFADRFAQHVCFGQRNSRERLRDAHYLLLIGNDAVGGLENGLELGQDVSDGLFAALAPHVDLVHSRVEGTGAHQRVRRDQVVEAIGAHPLQQVGSERGLELEHPDRATGAQHPVRLGVVELERVEIGSRAGALANGVQRVADDGERSEPEKIHLQHASVLERVHVVLRDDDGIFVAVAVAGTFGGLGADWDVLVERARCDDDAGGVHPGVSRQSLQLHRVIEEPAVAVLALLHLTGVVLAGSVKLADLRNALDRFLDGEREVRMVGNQLGEVVRFGRSEAKGSANIDGGP